MTSHESVIFATDTTADDNFIFDLKGAIKGGMYWLDPPFIVYHCGRSVILSKPWLLKNCKKKVSGNLRVCSKLLDQIAAHIGKM